MLQTLDNWIYPSLSNKYMQWNVIITHEMLDIAEKLSLEEHCQNTVKHIKDILPEPTICFSGGIDSQTVIDSFLLGGCKPNIVIFNYDGYNTEDVSHAIIFCESRKIDYRIIDLNVIRFLNNHLYGFATRYKISSPQFAVHLYLTLRMKELGYTNAIFGGNNLCLMEDATWYIPTKEETDWYNFSKEVNFPIIGNFWLQHWGLSLFATLNMPPFRANDTKYNYNVKVAGYTRMGYDVLPQDKKYNGFENIKKFYENMTGDGWTFEKEFRYPIATVAGKPTNFSINICPEILNRINRMKDNTEIISGDT
jgi:hypothetical protein